MPGLAPQTMVVSSGDFELGTIEAFSLFVLGGPGICYQAGRLALCADGMVGVERISALADGRSIFRADRQTVTGVIIRVGVEARYALIPRLEPVLGLSAWIRPNPVGFEIEGATQSYTDPDAAIILSLGTSVTIF